MSDTLRSTQKSYQATLDQIDRNVAGLEKQITDLKKRRADVSNAKAIVDEAVSKRPPPPADKKPAAPKP
jgi:prefoldin subunit 5